MSCESELTSADLDTLSTSTLQRVAGTSTSKNLFPLIHQDRCYGSNIASTSTSSASLPSIVLRANDTRNETDDDSSLTTIDDDDEYGMLMTVAFSDVVRIKQIMITAATGDERIDNCKVWVNRVDPPSLDEAQQSDIKPDQEFRLLDGERGCIDYPVRIARFSNVSNVTVYLHSFRPAKQRLYYLGFKGESRSYQKAKGDQIAVGAQNTADSIVQELKEQYGPAQTTIR